MLALVKTPRIELSLSGAEDAVSEILNFLRSRYPVAVLNPADDDSSVNAFETPFWKKTVSGDLIQGYRLKHGLSQQELAEKTGIKQSVISAYETGRRPLSRRAALRIGNALNEEPDKFFPESANHAG